MIILNILKGLFLFVFMPVALVLWIRGLCDYEYDPKDDEDDMFGPFKNSERRDRMKECCGTSKFHCPPEVPGQDDWYCNNGNSDAYALETDYNDVCEEWEGRT